MYGRWKEYADFHALVEVFMAGVYDLGSVKVRPDVIVDAGAHIGSFSVLASRKFPEAQILAFEPDPNNFILLEKNLRLNGAAVQTNNCALADFQGTTCLDGPTSMGRQIGSSTGVRTRVIRLSRYMDFGQISKLVLKIDVEGAEWGVLADCCSVLPKNTIVFIETHGGNSDVDRLNGIAHHFGFQHEKAMSKGECSENVLRRGEFL